MNKWKVMLSAVVIAAALAGCGAQEEQSAAEAQTDAAGELQQNGANGGAQPKGLSVGAGQMGAQADLMGKVKSIDGQTITLYKSAMGQGGPPQGDGTGEMPAGDEGQQLPASGEQPAAGERPQAPAGDGTAPEGGRGAMFTDETVDIQVTDTTKIVSVTFENEQMVEKEAALADLKSDDILSVMLKDDTQVAESVTIRTGGFGGGRGGGRLPQEEQQSTTSE